MLPLSASSCSSQMVNHHSGHITSIILCQLRRSQQEDSSLGDQSVLLAFAFPRLRYLGNGEVWTVHPPLSCPFRDNIPVTQMFLRTQAGLSPLGLPLIHWLSHWKGKTKSSAIYLGGLGLGQGTDISSVTGCSHSVVSIASPLLGWHAG